MKRRDAGEATLVAETDPLLIAVAAALRESGAPGCHACGEYVLETVAGVSPGGIMLACEAPGAAARMIEGRTGWPRFEGADGAELLLAGDGRKVTLVPLEGPDVASHLSGAGFTVLALALDLSEPPPRTVINPLGGLEDLEAGLLRAVDERAPALDPARQFLAADMHQRFGLVPDPGTLKVLRENALLVQDIDPRRAWRALSRLYSGTGLSGVSIFLRETGAMGHLLPEVSAIYDTPQNYYHHLDVWGHTMETLDRLEEMLEDPHERFRAHARELAAYLAEPVDGDADRRTYLAFAGLIHDVGKPGALTVEPSGRIRFQGHQSTGGSMAGSVAARLGLGRRATKHLQGIVTDHMRLGFLIKEGETTAARLRAVMEMGSHCAEVVMLSLADRLATRGEASTQQALERYSRLASRVMADWSWLRNCPPLIDGRDVMLHAGVGPGPPVAEALFHARVAQRECTVTSRAEALEFLAPDFKGKMDTRGR